MSRIFFKDILPIYRSKYSWTAEIPEIETNTRLGGYKKISFQACLLNYKGSKFGLEETRRRQRARQLHLRYHCAAHYVVLSPSRFISLKLKLLDTTNQFFYIELLCLSNRFSKSIPRIFPWNRIYLHHHVNPNFIYTFIYLLELTFRKRNYHFFLFFFFWVNYFK